MAGVTVLLPLFSNTAVARECECKGATGSLGLGLSSAKAGLILQLSQDYPLGCTVFRLQLS